MPRQAKNFVQVVVSVVALIVIMWLAFDVVPDAFDAPITPNTAAVPAEMPQETYQETERQASLPAPPVVKAPEPVEPPTVAEESEPIVPPEPVAAAAVVEPKEANAPEVVEYEPPAVPPPSVAPAPIARPSSSRETSLTKVADRMISEVSAIEPKLLTEIPKASQPPKRNPEPRKHVKALSKDLAAQVEAPPAPAKPVPPAQAAEAAPTITQTVSRAEVDQIEENQQTERGAHDDPTARFLVENTDRFEIYPTLGIRPHVWDPARGLLYDLDPVGRAARAGPDIVKIKLRGPNRSWFHDRHRTPISNLLGRHYDSVGATALFRRFVYLYVATEKASAYLARKNGDFLAYLRASGQVAKQADPWVTAVLFRLKAAGKEVAAYFPLGAVVERSGRRAWLATGIDFEKYLTEVDVDIGKLSPANARSIIVRLKHVRQAMRRKYS